MPDTINETALTVASAVLAQKIDAFMKQSDERHKDNVSRMDEIKSDVKDVKFDTNKINGRLNRAETKIAIHQWALGLIGAAMLVWAGAWLSKVL